jgi:hypothetical protein
MMGVYTGRLFRASRPGFEDFGIPSHLHQPARLYPAYIAIKKLFSAKFFSTL